MPKTLPRALPLSAKDPAGLRASGLTDETIRANGLRTGRSLAEKAKPAPVLNDYHPLTNAQGRTDAANARRLVSKFRDDLLWVGAWDKWLVWDGLRWKKDVDRRIDLKAKDIAAGLFEEIAALLRECKQ